MATLAAISITLAGGVGVFAVTLSLFGCAVVRRNTFVAARCEARPRNVIYNPDPKDPCQERGNTPIGWLIWVMRLTFDTMLNGVPGTGTRDGGLKGAMLKVNLDGVVLLRFHHLGLRVCTLATFLYLVVVLPIYYTACGDIYTETCISTQQNLTDYQRLTLASIPRLTPPETESLLSFFEVKEREYLGRLYAVVFCSWIVTWYALHQLRTEWVDLLAIRRVYYLEADHWGDRAEELEQIENDARDQEEDPVITRRAVWVPHPEQRDTVPNIELYSILVGGLPSLPTEAVEDVEAVFSKKTATDWQLNVTTAFFDHCVPNQPGFSSSVAAVTILPAASQLTGAWTQWYKAARKVRRLRFIRRRIADLRWKEVSNRGLQENGDASRIESQSEAESSRVVAPAFRQRLSVHDSEILGSNTDLEVEDHLFHALNFGPEQTAVYTREFALGAANFAPHGWFEGRIKRAGMGKLLEMEKAAALEVQRANLELVEARDRIAESCDGESSVDALSINEEDFASTAGSTIGSNHGSSSWNGKADSNRKLSIEERRKRLARSLSNSTFGTNSVGLNSVDGGLLPDNDFEEVEFEVELNDKLKNNGSTHSMDPLSVSRRSDGDASMGQKSTTSFFSISSLFDFSEKKAPTKIVSKASLETTRLTPDLDLEAGLWREQRKLSRGSFQHTARTKKTASLISKSPGGRQRMKRRGSIGQSTLIEDKPKRPIYRRVLSSGDLSKVGTENLLDEKKNETKSHTSKHHQPMEDMEIEIPLENETIWEKLKKDNERKAVLRARLDSFHSDENIGREHSSADGLPDAPRVWEKETENRNDSESSIPKEMTLPNSGGFSRPKEAGTGFGQVYNDAPISPAGRAMNSTSYGGLTSPYQGESEITQNLQMAYNFEERAGLRRRDPATMLLNSEKKAKKKKGKKIRKKTEKWYKVMTIVQETTKSERNDNVKERMIGSGRWKIPTFQDIIRPLKRRCFNCFYRVKFKLKPPEILDDFARDSTYAVVTFTSRQAAVAARHVLADSRGADRWVNLKDMPSPPLADAPVCAPRSGRGCVRPVTLSISDTQKKIRHYIALAALGTIYFFYTKPLSAVQNLVSSEKLMERYPDLKGFREDNPMVVNAFLGIIPALIWTCFFAICPALFKAISNFGSNATSSVKAENSALKYFWWFMVVSAFTGASFESAVVDGFKSGIQIGSQFQKVIEDTASQIPEKVSSNWLNWMLVRTFIVLPTQYLLQMNTFLFTWLGLTCCARAVRGGGAGAPVPYRIYVDSGVVMLCLFALAPASPLIAPAAMLYFFLCTPLLRWTMIFLYKPKFDIGGQRFPFICDICISGMVVGQILLTTMMALKRAPGPAALAGIPLIPTIWYRNTLRRRHLRAYKDVALLQTSLLDGWDVSEESNEQTREEFRRFLVDCHKAAYVPVCIASGDGRTLITAEPAVVIPLESDQEHNNELDESGPIDPLDESGRSSEEGNRQAASSRTLGSQRGKMDQKTSFKLQNLSPTGANQPGKMFRRASVGYRPPPT